MRYKYLKGGCHEGGARLFSAVPSDKMRSNSPKLRHKKFHSTWSRIFFTLGVARALAQAAQEGHEVFHWRHSKPTWKRSYHRLQVTLPYKGLGQVDVEIVEEEIQIRLLEKTFSPSRWHWKRLPREAVKSACPRCLTGVWVWRLVMWFRGYSGGAGWWVPWCS